MEHTLPGMVALLAEGVDRNTVPYEAVKMGRRVALLAEGVDRNFIPLAHHRIKGRRPPRGGRG